MKLHLHDYKVDKISLTNVTVDNFSMPDFLGRQNGFEIISFVIVKESYEGTYLQCLRGFIGYGIWKF